MLQKPFAVNLSVLTGTKKLPLATLLLLLLAQGCSFNPPLQQKGEAVLQGIWQQDTSAIDSKQLSYAVYKFTFDCDSFFVQMNNFSKVNYGADTCMKSGKWVEYAKGTYHLSNDTVTLKGQFCNANRSIKKEGGCFRYGNYEEAFKIKKTAGSVYQYLNLSATNPFNIRRIKDITCIPKPL